jgi:hypothetical protein
MADYDGGSEGTASSMTGSRVTSYRMTLMVQTRSPSGLSDLCKSKGKRCTNSEGDRPFVGWVSLVQTLAGVLFTNLRQPPRRFSPSSSSRPANVPRYCGAANCEGARHCTTPIALWHGKQ